MITSIKLLINFQSFLSDIFSFKAFHLQESLTAEQASFSLLTHRRLVYTFACIGIQETFGLDLICIYGIYMDIFICRYISTWNILFVDTVCL